MQQRPLKSALSQNKLSAKIQNPYKSVEEIEKPDLASRHHSLSNSSIMDCTSNKKNMQFGHGSEQNFFSLKHNQSQNGSISNGNFQSPIADPSKKKTLIFCSISKDLKKV